MPMIMNVKVASHNPIKVYVPFIEADRLSQENNQQKGGNITMKKQLGVFLLGLGIMVLMATSLYADDDRCRRRTQLVATDEGEAINARGEVEIRAERDRERFKVEFRANVADGTRFWIFANDIFVGEFTSRGDEVEVDLRSEDGTLPDEIRPVCDIRSIVVAFAETGPKILFGDL